MNYPDWANLETSWGLWLIDWWGEEGEGLPSQSIPKQVAQNREAHKVSLGLAEPRSYGGCRHEREREPFPAWFLAPDFLAYGIRTQLFAGLWPGSLFIRNPVTLHQESTLLISTKDMWLNFQTRLLPDPGSDISTLADNDAIQSVTRLMGSSWNEGNEFRLDYGGSCPTKKYQTNCLKWVR